MAESLQTRFILKTAFRFLAEDELSALRLLSCNGVSGYGTNFTDSFADVNLIYHHAMLGEKEFDYVRIHTFSEAFPTGFQSLAEFIEWGEKPNIELGEIPQVVDKLLSFILRIEEASIGLIENTERSKMQETEWSARLAVHFFSQLMLSKNFIMDCHSLKKCDYCPCGCGQKVPHGNTTIGSPKTWYGQFDIVIGKDVNRKLKNEAIRAEVDNVGASVIPEDTTDSDLSAVVDSSIEDLSQTEVKSNDLLSNYRSQIVSQTIVFSFHQKMHFSFLNFVPSIAVSKEEIQFHFYDSEKDLYLQSRKMKLFDKKGELHLPTVLATWLVLNYRLFMSEASASMLEEGKFGFHSLAQDNLALYKGELSMGNASFKPNILEISTDNVNKVYTEPRVTGDTILQACRKRKIHPE